MAISKEVLGDEFLSNVVGSVGTMPSLQMLPDSSRRKRKTVSSASSNQGAGLSLGPDVGINSIDNLSQKRMIFFFEKCPKANHCF